MAFRRFAIAFAVATGLLGTSRVTAEPAAYACSLRAAFEGTCVAAATARLQAPAPPATATPPAKRRDSLKNGAIIGGSIGLALGLLASGISDCPGDNPSGSCPAARVGGVVVSTAVWAGIGIGLDALVTDRTHAVGPPASRLRNRLRTLPPRPSLAMRLRW